MSESEGELAGTLAPVSETPPLPLNESNPPTETPADGSLFEKVKRVAGPVFERAGVLYRRNPKGGRPRRDADGNQIPAKGDIAINVPGTALPEFIAPPGPASVAPAPTPLDVGLVKRCVGAMGKAVQTILDRRLFRIARRAGYEPDKAQQLLVDCSISKDEVDSFGELAAICLQNYGVGTRYAPEIGMSVLAAGITVRYATAFKSLEDEIEEQRKRQKG